MKNRIINIALIVVCICIPMFALSQDLPSNIEKALNSKYPGAEIDEWYAEDAEYEIYFEHKGTQVIAIFDEDAQLIKTTTTIDEADLPAALKTKIEKTYVGATYDYVKKVVENGSSSYDIGIEAEDEYYTLYIDSEGNIEEL